MLNAPLIRNTRLSKEEYEARYRALQATLSQLNDIILEALSEDDVEDAEMIEVLFDFNRVAELERTLSLERSGSLLTIDSEEFVKASDCLHEMEAAEKTGTFLKTSSLSSLRTSDGGSSAGLDASVLAKDCDLKAHVHLLISIIRDQPLRTNLEAALTYLLKSIEVLNSIDFDKTSPEELLKFKTQCEDMSERLEAAKPTAAFPFISKTDGPFGKLWRLSTHLAFHKGLSGQLPHSVRHLK